MRRCIATTWVGYVNFMSDDEGEARVKASYGVNYDRLVAVKRKSDPSSTNLYRRARPNSADRSQPVEPYRGAVEQRHFFIGRALGCQPLEGVP